MSEHAATARLSHLLTLSLLACGITVQAAVIPSYLNSRNYDSWVDTTTADKRSFPAAFVPNVTWVSCPPSGANPFEENVQCANITAPRDYYDLTVGNVSLALYKYSATNATTEGPRPLFLNPGGPGADSSSFFKANAEPYPSLIKNISGYGGGSYDVIGVDLRGVGGSTPTLQCFTNASDYEEFIEPFTDGVISPGISYELYDQDREAQLDSLEEQVAQQLDVYTRLFAKCQETMGFDALKYYNTASNVRDFDFLTQVLYGNSTRINYYGVSYGSVLGVYLANLLPPNRIGHVVVDGINDPKVWSDLAPNRGDNKQDAEKTWAQWFIPYCVKAGPEACPLLNGTNITGPELYDRIDSFLIDLHLHPRNFTYPSLDPTSNSTINITVEINDATVHNALQGDLASPVTPAGFQTAAVALSSALYSGNFSAFVSTSPLTPAEAAIPTIDLTAFAATLICSDGPHYANTTNITDRSTGPVLPNYTAREYAADLQRQLQGDSPHFGADNLFAIGCDRHPATGHSPERFAGPFDGEGLETPVLIISNTADPSTPLIAGKNLAGYLGGNGRLLVLDSPSHHSLLKPSECLDSAKRAYFVDGKLPDEGTVCGLDNTNFFA